MTKVKAKQILRVLGAYIKITGFTANGASTVITSALNTALGTAGDGGVSVPVQVSSSNGIGVVTSGSSNRVEIYDNTTKQKISASGNEVYGRITESGGVYTLTYYSLVNGTETAYTSFSSKSIDVEFIYRFSFDTLPTDALVGIKSREVSDDVSGQARLFTEQRTPTGTNTIPDLSFTPDQNYNVELIVNGQAVSQQSSPTPFTISGKTITWSAANAGFSVDATDDLVACYTTLS